MNQADSVVIAAVICCIAIFLLTWITGLIKHHLPLYISYLNGICGLAVIVCGLQQALRTTQHVTDIAEVAVLCAEGLLVGLSGYFIFSKQTAATVIILQYIYFGLHILALVLFLAFMLTFKITKLF